MTLQSGPDNLDRLKQALFDGLPPLADILEGLNSDTGVLANAFKVDPQFTAILWYLIQHSLRSPSAIRKARIWTGDRPLGAEGLIDLAKTISAYATMDDWLERELPEQAFCIVLNNMETFDPVVESAAAHYIRPYLDQVDGDVAITVGTFSGRYDYSPIGIHQDENLFRAIHFHYGPGTKYLHAWRADQIPQSAVGRSPTLDLMEKATTHTVRTNDILNIETPVLHVGSAPDLCTNLCLLFRKHSEFQRLEIIGKELASDQVTNPFAEASDPKSTPDDWAERPLTDLLTEAGRLFRLANRSNGGLAAKPVASEAKLTTSSVLTVKTPSLFPVIQTQSFGKDLLIARRQMRYIPAGDGVRRWVNALTDGHAVKASDFMSFKDDGRDRLALWEFLRWLSGTGALSVQS